MSSLDERLLNNPASSLLLELHQDTLGRKVTADIKTNKRNKKNISDDQNEVSLNATSLETNNVSNAKSKKKKKSVVSSEDKLDCSNEDGLYDVNPPKKKKSCKPNEEQEQIDDLIQEHPKRKKKSKIHNKDKSICQNLQDPEKSKRKKKKSLNIDKENERKILECTKKIDSGLNITSSENKESNEAKKKKKKHRVKKVVIDPNIGKRELRALEYLHTWVNNRSHWKFEKVAQLWLMQNSLECSKVSDEDFVGLLEYMVEVKGKIRERTLTTVLSIVEKYSEEQNKKSDDATEGKEGNCVTESMANRGKKVIKVLQNKTC